MNLDQALILILILYFFLISTLALLTPSYISTRKIYLFRCLFPSWKFYEDICYLPEVYFRVSHDGMNFLDWKQGITKIERNWAKFFINPEANLIHAYNTLLQQVESDKEELTSSDPNDFINSVSYGLVKNLVMHLIKLEKIDTKYFQFKLRSTLQGNPDDYEDTLISIVHEVTECTTV